MSDADWSDVESEESWPSDEGASSTSDETSSQDLDEIGEEMAEDQAFCYVSSGWAVPNTTIHAPTREKADKKAPIGLTYCHDGSCMYEGKFEPLEEGCG
jgi:hypothetical protein